MPQASHTRAELENPIIALWHRRPLILQEFSKANLVENRTPRKST